MKILVTGATGFIGNHVVTELLKDSKNEIIATSRDITKAQKYDWYKKVKYIQYDIDSNDIGQNLYELFDAPDILIHLSWEGLPNYNNLIHIEKNLYRNYNFLKNLIQNGLDNVSITGTCFEYGMVNGKLSEELIPQPSNSYAIAKDTLRKFIEELNKDYTFNYNWIRLFYMYGEGQSNKSLLSLVDKAIKNGDKEFNMSGGEQLRDYLQVTDVVTHIISIAKQTKINGIINCCNGTPISVRSLVENYLNEKKYKLNLNFGHYPYPSYEPMAFWGCVNKLNSILEQHDY